MGQGRRGSQGHRRGKRGQSLTEFAIMLPIIVLVTWFSIYFFEVMLVRLKLLEASRYATWEFTAIPLHDYSSRHVGQVAQVGRFLSGMAFVMADATTRYEDLDSADWPDLPAWRTRRNTFLSVGWEMPLFIINEGWKPNLSGNMAAEWGFRGLLMALSAIAGREVARSVRNPFAVGPAARTIGRLSTIDGAWGFNRRGWVFTRAEVGVYNTWIPRQLGGRTLQPTVRLWAKTALLADTWRLNDGRDVRHGQEKDKGFYRQVERIFLLDRATATPATAAMEFLRFSAGLAPMSGLLPVPQVVPDATVPVVVSLNHREGEDGRIKLQTDGGRSTFDTAPLTVRDGQNKQPYLETLRLRGKYFMGCPETMNPTCGAGLTSNPFGDGVHWPPPGGR